MPRYLKKNLVLNTLICYTLVAFFSCASPRMLLPEGLTSKAEEMPVKIKKFWYFFNIQSMNFGPYKVTKVSKGWARGGEFKVGAGAMAYAANESKQRFGFSFKTAQSENWKCECKAQASQTKVEGKAFGGNLDVPLEKQLSLDCTFMNPEENTTWNLNLTRNGMKSTVLAGKLSDGKSQIQVESTDKNEQSNFSLAGTMGYLFRDSTHVLGAVQTLSEQTVWLTPEATSSMRPQLGATAAAMILYHEIFNSSLNSTK